MTFLTNRFYSLIGFEIHVKLATKSKIFSKASALPARPTNTQVSLLDMSVPGSLPYLNRSCLEAGIRMAFGLHCSINKSSFLERKHYFYPDSPSGYQITQQRKPYAFNGFLEYPLIAKRDRLQAKYVPDKKEIIKKCRIDRIQLEHDTGRSIHDEHDQRTLIDLNRSGTGLLEIVTHPDIRTSVEGESFLRELNRLLIAYNICEQSGLETPVRVDANVSVHEKNTKPTGFRVEIKNISSFVDVKNAVDFELKRQERMLLNAQPLCSETRTYDSNKRQTIHIRRKEEKIDYCFMPEPNLPPLYLYDDNDIMPTNNPNYINIDEIHRQLPLSPFKQREQMQIKYKDFLTTEHIFDLLRYEMMDYFNELMALVEPSDINRQHLILEVLLDDVKRMTWGGEKMNKFVKIIKPELFLHIIDYLERRIITRFSLYEILLISYKNKQPDKSLEQILNDNNLVGIVDNEKLVPMCQQVIDDNPKLAEKYKTNPKKAIEQLRLAICKQYPGRIHNDLVIDIFTDILNKQSS
ncbi:unnamed protein product [Didymodactylos carnosus]|uniref:Glutamyl-tRNA(Gln) amidotransferase subunit B, mitochondrial n=1 Tax=Didymodactylos carnosus TaxID=1234261 RepID=A0A813X2P2_9BILA|nr:unnamed protein product [Didymodactylos carnosus]CAF1177307.1 unnamed protein product [Didymodactylos carnosus]CAF3651216.1 unnamed protein product [Didymodactylos carnosus]CAF3988588.1 unnamed protein product [Didymodactylos carnosus]